MGARRLGASGGGTRRAPGGPSGAPRGPGLPYITVDIPVGRWDASDVQRGAAILNSRLGPGMLVDVSRDPLSVRLRLHKADMAELERAAGSLAGCRGLGRRILEEVRSIGSYGVSGGARQYAGYDAERRVRGRRAKARSRQGVYYARPFDAPDAELPRGHTNRVLCADSERELRKLPDNCIDLVFTSPPYNFGLDYGEAGGDSVRWQDYFDKLFAVLGECARVLKRGGRMAVNVQPLFSDYIPAHHMISSHLTGMGLIWKGEILWEKNNYNCKYTAWGSWRSPSSPYLKYTWEFVEVFCKGSLKKSGSAADADISGDDFKKWVYAKWSISPERRMGEYNHPAMFPEELARRVLGLFSFRNDAVLDPFSGAGTTCAVAKKTGRRYLGIDVSEEYTRTAAARLASIRPGGGRPPSRADAHAAGAGLPERAHGRQRGQPARPRV